MLQAMAVPPKRRSSRTGRRAEQTGRTTPPQSSPTAPAPVANPAPATEVPQWIAAPPRTGCPPWHFYWCDGHDDWHHHTEPAVRAIEATIAPA